MPTLEKRLEKTFDGLNIPEEERNSLGARLKGVKERDVPTYKHSIRVGLKSVEVARFLHLEPKTLLYAGLLHDIGKGLTDPDSLKKIEGFNGKDMDELKKHPLRGYEMIRGISDFLDYIAGVVLRSHQYGEDPYPKQLPKPKKNYSKSELVMMGYHSRLLALIDFYDSLLHRKNGKHYGGKRKLPTHKEAREIILEQNKDQEYLIHELYKAKIFR